jgi:hypothetical protein
MINTAPGCHVVKLSRCKGQFSVNLRAHENKVIKSAGTNEQLDMLSIELLLGQSQRRKTATIFSMFV